MHRNRHFVFRESILRQTGMLRALLVVAALCGLSLTICVFASGATSGAKILGVVGLLIQMVAFADMRAAINRINQYFV